MKPVACVAPDPTYKTVFALQILRCELLPIKILQRKRTANLRLSNTLAHFRNAFPLQTGLLDSEVNHHTSASQHKEQRRLPGEGTSRVTLLQLTHGLSLSVGSARREAIPESQGTLDVLAAARALR